LSGLEVIRVLSRVGFSTVGQRGSHVKLRGLEGQIVIVPNHKELARGTLSGIIRQAGLTPGEFIDLL
jgi:predicted RNA binding protein YcfA (HicA-like mRNA interferase family)